MRSTKNVGGRRANGGVLKKGADERGRERAGKQADHPPHLRDAKWPAAKCDILLGPLERFLTALAGFIGHTAQRATREPPT